MAFNRTSYDKCAFNKYVQESTDVLKHSSDLDRYSIPQQCRHSLIGIIQENSVSSWMPLPHKRQVDVETDLLGINRANSRCPSVKYSPLKTCPHSGNVMDSNCNKPNSLKTCSKCVKQVDNHIKCKKPIIRYHKKVDFKDCDKNGVCYRKIQKSK